MAGDGFTAKDFNAHEKTYGSFIGLFKYGAIAAFVIAALVVLLITR